MTDETKFVIAGGLINAALFLVGVFVAGLVAGNHVVVVLALANVGLTVAHYGASLAKSDGWAFYAHIASNALAVVAAMVLIRGYWL